MCPKYTVGIFDCNLYVACPGHILGLILDGRCRTAPYCACQSLFGRVSARVSHTANGTSFTSRNIFRAGSNSIAWTSKADLSGEFGRHQFEP